MATKYLRGAGTGAWNTDASWSTTSSAGAANTTKPVAGDAVILDAGSTVNCVINGASQACASIDCTGYTYNLSHEASRDLTVSGNIIFVATMTYTPNSRKITSSATGVASITIASGGREFYDLTFICTGATAVTLSDDITVNNILNFSTGNSQTHTFNGYSFHCKGTFQSHVTGGTSTGTTVIYIDGTADQIHNQTNGLCNLNYVVDKPSGTLTFTNTSNSVTLYGIITFTRGTMNFGSSVIAFGGTTINWTSGTITVGTSDIRFLSNITIPAGFLTAVGKFYKLTVGSNGKTIVLGANATVSNTLYQTASNSTDTLNGYNLYVEGNITKVNNNSQTLAGTTNIILNGTGNQTISSSAGAWAFTNAVSVVKNSGTLTLTTNVIFTGGLVVSAPNHPSTSTVKKNITYAPNNAYTGTKTAQAALAGL